MKSGCYVTIPLSQKDALVDTGVFFEGHQVGDQFEAKMKTSAFPKVSKALDVTYAVKVNNNMEGCLMTVLNDDKGLLRKQNSMFQVGTTVRECRHGWEFHSKK